VLVGFFVQSDSYNSTFSHVGIIASLQR
jgi:hypothetical protein